MRRNGKGLTGAELFWGTLGDEAASPGAKQKFKCEKKAVLTTSIPAAARPHCISRRLRLIEQRVRSHQFAAPNEEEPCSTVCRCVSKIRTATTRWNTRFENRWSRDALIESERIPLCLG